MKNIVLIGMPGVGKSTVGVVLAKVLGYDFLDSDLVIQKKDGRRIHEIIEQEGTEQFIALEDQVNASINVENSIIATGGSAVFGHHAMEHLSKNGIVVYLSVPYEVLVERLGDLNERGVVTRPGQTLLDVYNERCPLYKKYADIKVDEEHLDIRSTVDAIMQQLDGKLTSI